jgi:hypothetical protein
MDKIYLSLLEISFSFVNLSTFASLAMKEHFSGIRKNLINSFRLLAFSDISEIKRDYNSTP